MSASSGEAPDYNLPVVQESALRMMLQELATLGSDGFEDRLLMRMRHRNSKLVAVLGELFRAADMVAPRQAVAVRTGMIVTHQLIDYQARLDAPTTVASVFSKEEGTGARTVGDLMKVAETRMRVPKVSDETIESVRADMGEADDPYDYLDHVDLQVPLYNPKIPQGVFGLVRSIPDHTIEMLDEAGFAMSMTHQFLSMQANADTLNATFNTEPGSAQ